MPPIMILGFIVRHLMTFAGGAAVATSTTAASVTTAAPDEQAIIGATVTLIGMVWSYYKNRKAAANA